MSVFDPNKWSLQHYKKEWCVVEVCDCYMVVPTNEVIDVRHIVLKDVTHKDAKLWAKMMR